MSKRKPPEENYWKDSSRRNIITGFLSRNLANRGIAYFLSCFYECMFWYTRIWLLTGKEGNWFIPHLILNNLIFQLIYVFKNVIVSLLIESGAAAKVTGISF